jgi:predicted ATPase
MPPACVRFVDHDARQPCGQPGARFELVQVREGVQIRLLQDIFHLVIAFHDGARRAIELLIVPAHHDLEQRVFAAPDPPDQLIVSNRRAESRGRQAELGILRRVHG